MSKSYVHYGAKHFNKDKFEPIKNRGWGNKPIGGFWASPTDTLRGWKEFNDWERIAKCNDDNAVTFTIDDTARVLPLHNKEDYEWMAERYGFLVDLDPPFPPVMHYDFERIAHDFDVIDFKIGHEMSRLMYGWDCDCILVLNPDVVCEAPPEYAYEQETLDCTEEIESL